MYAPSDNVVRLVIISDTHGHHELLNEHLPEGDMIIHCGDFTDRGSTDHACRFARWFSGLSMYAEKLVISGNHDRNLKDPSAIDFAKLFPSNLGDDTSSVRFLQDELYVSPRSDLRIFGASWQACEEKDGVGRQLQLLNEEQTRQCGTNRSDNQNRIAVDVLLTHMIPYNTVVPVDPSIASVHPMAWEGGSRDISRAVLRHRIPLCIGGHIHYGRGATHSGISTFVNASSVTPGGTSGRAPIRVSPPVIIDYDVEIHKVSSIQCVPHT